MFHISYDDYFKCTLSGFFLKEFLSFFRCYVKELSINRTFTVTINTRVTFFPYQDNINRNDYFS